jgi:hypothetical protein
LNLSCDPASEWWIIPGGTGRPVWSRRHRAIFRQSSTNATSLTVEADQPTIARENRSIANATYTNPAQVAT